VREKNHTYCSWTAKRIKIKNQSLISPARGLGQEQPDKPSNMDNQGMQKV